MYPLGHPSLDPAARAVVHRAELLLEDRPRLSLGVARQQLVIEGVATDPKHPVLRELAGRMHRHHLGAVTFSRGLEVHEVGEMLRLLGVDADRSGTPIGLGPRDALPAWPHLRLHPLTFEKLELLEDAPTSGGQAADHPGAGVRAAQLWLGLARSALASEASREEDTAATPTEPAVIARAIDAHPRGDAYDQVIVAHLLQIAGELKGAGGAEGAALRRRTAKLVGTMQPDTLRRLLEMGGDEGQRRPT